MQQQDMPSGTMIPRKAFRRLSWSRRALIAMVTAFLVSIALSVIDGFITDAQSAGNRNHWLLLGRVWNTDLRFLAEQVMYAATILFIGAKFFEQRTVISIGIDREDIGRMAVNGPDDNNVIWIGRKYTSRLEAESAVNAMRSRLLQSGESNFGEFGF